MASTTVAAVEEAFVRNHDSYSTVNAVIYILLAMLCCVFAFYYFFVSNRATEEYSMFRTLFTGPVFGICVTGILTIAVLWYRWHSGTGFGGVVWVPFIGLIITLGVSLALQEQEKMDLWHTDRPPVPATLSDTATFFYWALILLSFAGVIFAYMRGTLRTDRLAPTSPAFFCFFLSAIFLGVFFTYVMAFIWQSLGKTNLGNAGRSTLYFLGAVVIFLFFGISTMIASYLIPWLTKNNLFYTYGAVDAGAAEATQRTKQMTQVAMASTVIIPTILVFMFRDSMVEKESPENIGSISSRIGLGILLGIPIVCILAMIGLEMQMLIPKLFSLVSAFLVTFGVLTVGLGIIPWTPTTVAILGGAILFMILNYLVSFRSLPALTISIMIAFSFIVTKFVSRTVLLSLEDKKGEPLSDGYRFLLMGVPILVFTGVWFFRSWYTGQGYSIPVLFFMFSIFYTFSFFDTASDPKLNLFLKNEDQWTNIGVDFTIVLCIVILFSSLGGFTRYGADLYEENISANYPVAVNIAVYMVYGVLAYVAALMYHSFQALPNFQSFVSELQNRSKQLFSVISKDVEKATDWKNLI